MRGVPRAAALLPAAAAAAAPPPLAEALRAAVERELRKKSAASNGTAWGVSYRDADLALSWCAGESDLASGAACSATDSYAWGSMTKPSTALLVLQRVADGQLALDEALAPRADPFLRREWGTSVAALYGAAAARATVREVLQMRLGLLDYDDDLTRSYTNAHPDVDLGPDWYLDAAQNRTPACAPGECGIYSGASYVLLGALAAELAGAPRWDAFDQTSWMRGGARGRFPGFRYAAHGPCRGFVTASGAAGGTVHGYQPRPRPAPGRPRPNGPGADVYNISCLFGWTMGNLVAPTADVAEFWWALLGPEGDQLLSAPLRGEMLRSQPARFCQSRIAASSRHLPECLGPPGELSYGLGVMNFSAMHWGLEQRGQLYGHDGVTYGFAGQAAYHPGLRFSWAVSHNEEVWMGPQHGNNHSRGELINPVYGVIVDTVARYRATAA